MVRIGEWCNASRVPLRSGHAEGADWAFEQGAQELCIAYLPWAGFNSHLKSRAKKPVLPLTSEVLGIVERVHPNYRRLSSGALKLQGRNVFQVFGSRLSVPTSCVVCWTPGGADVGGTATAIRMARSCKGVPVYNLAVCSVDFVLGKLSSIQGGPEDIGWWVR